MNKWGYDEIVIWGLFINHSWSLDVSRSIEAGRDRAIRMLLDEAHWMNIRVMSGLGVYSWGFEAEYPLLMEHLQLDELPECKRRIINTEEIK